MQRTLPKCIERVVLKLLEDLDTPRALQVHTLIRYGEWDQLVNLNIDPAQYTSPDKYYRDAVATELLRKCRDIPGYTEKVRHAASVKAFYEAEMSCKVTNDRFSTHLHNGPYEDPSEVRIADYLQRVKRLISRILGPLPRFLDGRHGPGATYGDRGQRTTVPDKMSSRPTATLEARSFIPFWEDTAWCRMLMEFAPDRSDPETVRGNRFTTVPKDAKKNRGICIEPSLNIFFQLAIGKHIRQRLRAFGIDLDEGQTLHRRVACLASITGMLCTIDLSSASDTVAKLLVKYLLPEPWYEVLSSLRSPFTLIEGRQQYLEKFSSMGNGFTFELETLIFVSLAMVATEASGIDPLPGENVFCFGDDIIVPTRSSRGLLALLRYCGFTPNERKTFTKGVFRESCGGDFFKGVSVRPHYIEEFPDEPTAWISLVNGIRRMAAQYMCSHSDLGPFQRAWFCALDFIPSDIRRLRGPIQLGDVTIHDDRSRWSIRTIGGTRYFGTYSPIRAAIPLSRWDVGTQLASALYGVPSTGVIPRKGGVDSVTGYRIRWSIPVLWEDHGTVKPYPDWVRKSGFSAG